MFGTATCVVEVEYAVQVGDIRMAAICLHSIVDLALQSMLHKLPHENHSRRP